MKFTKAHRLRRRREFLAIGARGRKLHTRDFLILWTPRDRPPPRLGVTVTAKVGGSVVRTRIKRYVRESFRAHAAEMAAPADLSVIAKRSAAEADFRGVDGQLGPAMRKIGRGAAVEAAA